MTEHVEDAQPDLKSLVASWRLWRDAALAVLAGVGLSLTFPPLEWAVLAWLALLPLLLAPVPAPVWRRVLSGALFGLGFFVPNLWWLNTIGFCAGVLLAMICACFPLAWYLFAAALVRRLAVLTHPDAEVRVQRSALGPVCIWDLGALSQILLVLLLPAGWVALEWVRGWIFTGFPWNQLGISQWARPNLLPLVTITGVYGISFLIVAVNTGLAISWPRIAVRFTGRRTAGVSWGLMAVVLFFLPVFLLNRAQKPLPPPDDVLRVWSAQGNIPQCRIPTQEQFDESLQVYAELTRAAVRGEQKPDLIVWPETAVPSPLRFDEAYWKVVSHLFPDVRTAMLIGTVDFRPAAAAAAKNGKLPKEDIPPMFNSVLHFGPSGRLLETYDKMHLVPFGEYTPFGKYLPWLENWIGMGRDLTAGREYTIFSLPQDVRAGVMICFEDAFPGIARGFANRNADVLMTLTNDAWYAESAGSRQHLIHAVFRAVETRRPLFRAGNNSGTCLIWPNGHVTGLLRDPATGSPFYRGGRLYEIPVWRDPQPTWYALHGDVFAWVCSGLAGAATAGLAALWVRRKAALRRALTPESPAPAVQETA